MAFQRAQKRKRKLKLALIGPSGSGKSFTALTIATSIGKNVIVFDTEGGSANDYADKFVFDAEPLETFHPNTYIKYITQAEELGYDVVVLDSLSHAWFGSEGALELVNKAATRSKSGNTYFAWRDVTPLHNALVNKIIQSKCHVIATMRTKEKYVVDEEGGKSKPKKIGLEAIQREGMNYEFTIVGEMDMDHNMIITKTRWDEIDNEVIHKPGKEFARKLMGWLDSGVDDSAVQPPKVVDTPIKVNEVTETEIDASNVDSDLAIETPIQSERVRSKLDQVFKYLTSVSVDTNENVELAARILICAEFGVSNAEDVPDDRFDEFYKFLQVPLLKTLRADGFIK